MKKNFDWLAPVRWDHKNMNFVEAMLGDYFDEDKWAEMWNEIEEAKKAFEKKNNRIALMTEASEINYSLSSESNSECNTKRSTASRSPRWRPQPERRMEVLADNNVVARKDHVCNFCSGEIKKGEKYNIQTIKDNGEIYTWKAHLTCLMVVLDADYDDGLTQDDFRHIVMEDYAQQGKCLGCPHKDDKCAEMQSFEECLPYVVNYICST